MADSLGGSGIENEEDYGDLTPTQQQTVTTGIPLSSSSKPNPINPLLAGSKGPLSELESSRFDYKSLKYPLDVEDNPRFQYYIKFNVLMNIRSKYTEQLSFGDPTQQAAMSAEQSNFWANRGKTAVAAATSQPANPTNISGIFKTQTVKTEQSISLYMPDQLNWSFENKWEDVSVSQKLGKAGMAMSLLSTGVQGTADVIGSLPSLNPEELTKKLASSGTTAAGTAVLGEAIGSAMGIGADLGLAAVGFALNPSVEVLYKQPELRSLQFEFIFAPRNRKEAEVALTIVQMFKFHSAPEFYGGPDLGRYYVPPSQFDIEFIGRNGQLWQLGKILTQCVLTNVTVNYGQSGKFATFEDGTPTNIQLQLNFKETAFITKELVEKGY